LRISGKVAERLKILGIEAQRERNMTLRSLVYEVNKGVRIDLLGYSPEMIVHHASRAAASMTGYIDLKRSSPPSRENP